MDPTAPSPVPAAATVEQPKQTSGEVKPPALCVHVKDVLSWKNTVVTSVALVGVNLCFILFWVTGFSLVGLLCFLGLVAMGVGLAYSIMMSDPAGAEHRVEVVLKMQVEDAAVCLYDAVNSFATEVRHLLLWKDHASSAKACAILGVLAYVASWFSFAVFTYLAVNLLFFHRQLCTAYEKYAAPHVHKGIALLKSHIHKLSTKCSAAHAKTS